MDQETKYISEDQTSFDYHSQQQIIQETPIKESKPIDDERTEHFFKIFFRQKADDYMFNRPKKVIQQKKYDFSGQISKKKDSNFKNESFDLTKPVSFQGALRRKSAEGQIFGVHNDKIKRLQQIGQDFQTQMQRIHKKIHEKKKSLFKIHNLQLLKKKSSKLSQENVKDYFQSENLAPQSEPSNKIHKKTNNFHERLYPQKQTTQTKDFELPKSMSQSTFKRTNMVSSKIENKKLAPSQPKIKIVDKLLPTQKLLPSLKKQEQILMSLQVSLNTSLASPLSKFTKTSDVKTINQKPEFQTQNEKWFKPKQNIFRRYNQMIESSPQIIKKSPLQQSIDIQTYKQELNEYKSLKNYFNKLPDNQQSFLKIQKAHQIHQQSPYKFKEFIKSHKNLKF